MVLLYLLKFCILHVHADRYLFFKTEERFTRILCLYFHNTCFLNIKINNRGICINLSKNSDIYHIWVQGKLDQEPEKRRGVSLVLLVSTCEIYLIHSNII